MILIQAGSGFVKESRLQPLKPLESADVRRNSVSGTFRLILFDQVVQTRNVCTRYKLHVTVSGLYFKFLSRTLKN